MCEGGVEYGPISELLHIEKNLSDYMRSCWFGKNTDYTEDN